jgi:hypothetical protein
LEGVETLRRLRTWPSSSLPIARLAAIALMAASRAVACGRRHRARDVYPEGMGPSAQPVQDWLAVRLGQTYPQLASRDGATRAALMLATGKIAVMQLGGGHFAGEQVEHPPASTAPKARCRRWR